jgi:hypothetical protein
MQKTAAPAITLPAPAGNAGALPVAGFGYFPSGADRPFAQANAGPGTPNIDGPFSRYYHRTRWW